MFINSKSALGDLGTCLLWALVGVQATVTFMAYKDMLAQRQYRQKLGRLQNIARAAVKQRLEAHEHTAEEGQADA